MWAAVLAFILLGAPGGGLVLVDGSGKHVDILMQPQVTGGWGGYSWSPDGSKIAFSNEASQISILDVGSPKERVLRDEQGSIDPVYAPDGNRIAYLNGELTPPARESLDAWVMNADGSAPRRLTHDGGFKDRVAWSHDGSRLLVVGRAGTQIVDPTTGAVLERSPDRLTYSPDESRIAYASANGTIDVANADGSGRHRVAGGGAHDPVWSPDGTRIAFTRGRCLSNCGAAFVSIYVVDADGTGQRRLTGPRTGGPGATVRGRPDDRSDEPLWWPDGKQILYLRYDTSTGAFAMNADGTCEHEFVVVDAGLADPSWRPGLKLASHPRRCVDLRVRAVPRGPVIRGKTGTIDVVVENDGNESATGVRLALQLEGRQTVTLRRRLDPIGPGRSRRLAVTMPAVTGTPDLLVHASVRAAQASSNPAVLREWQALVRVRPR